MGLVETTTLMVGCIINAGAIERGMLDQAIEAGYSFSMMPTGDILAGVPVVSYDRDLDAEISLETDVEIFLAGLKDLQRFAQGNRRIYIIKTN